MQLNPQEYFTIVRQIDNPYDTATYYVKATIRNARTDATIETVYLTNRGDGRFSKEWQVPVENSGGVYISIVTEIYTDSAYTTLSEIYGREEHTYLIQERFNRMTVGGRGINYIEVAKIFKQELEKLLPKKEVAEKVDMKPIMESLNKVKLAIEKIQIPTPEKIDFSKVIKNISDIGNIIRALPSPEKLNLNPVLTSLDSLKGEMSYIQNIVEQFKVANNSIRQLVGEFDSIKKQTEDTKKEIDGLVDFVRNEGFTLKLKTEIEKPQKPLEKPIKRTFV